MSRKNRRKAVIIPPLTDDRPHSVTMTGNQGLFFSSNEAARDFNSVLHEVQEYISSKYAALITDGGTEEVKAQIKRYITKYVVLSACAGSKDNTKGSAARSTQTLQPENGRKRVRLLLIAHNHLW